MSPCIPGEQLGTEDFQHPGEEKGDSYTNVGERKEKKLSILFFSPAILPV